MAQTDAAASRGVDRGHAALLDVRDLRVGFPAAGREAMAVDGVTLELARGQTLGIVGESGSGKSLTALALMDLVPPPGHWRADFAQFDGKDLLRLGSRERRRLRGAGMAMIFQEPATALNPVASVGDQIAEVAIIHEGLGRRAARARAIEALAEVEIRSPRERAGDYPHQLSGGMRQRAMIAMALAGNPALLIADEPTTALDVTVEAQILDLVARLGDRFGMAILFISHNLAVVAEIADRMAVMYAGRIVEQGPIEDVLRAPCHPYTAALLAAVPRLGARRDRLAVIPGRVPHPLARPQGCRFRARCARESPRCAEAEPDLSGGIHSFACFHPL